MERPYVHDDRKRTVAYVNILSEHVVGGLVFLDEVDVDCAAGQDAAEEEAEEPGGGGADGGRVSECSLPQAERRLRVPAKRAGSGLRAHPPRKAPTGFRGGRGAASGARRGDEVCRARGDEVRGGRGAARTARAARETVLAGPGMVGGGRAVGVVRRVVCVCVCVRVWDSRGRVKLSECLAVVSYPVRCSGVAARASLLISPEEHGDGCTMIRDATPRVRLSCTRPSWLSLLALSSLRLRNGSP